MAEHVIALDPGERTGYASAVMSKDVLKITDVGVLPRKEMALWLAYQQDVEGPKGQGPSQKTYDRMVWEAWTPRPQNGSMDWIQGNNLLSVRHIGHFELVAWLSSTPTWEYGAVRKTAFQASMPPKLRDLQDGQSEQHSKDALMHLWGWFFQNWWTGEKRPEECIR